MEDLLIPDQLNVPMETNSSFEGENLLTGGLNTSDLINQFMYNSGGNKLNQRMGNGLVSEPVDPIQQQLNNFGKTPTSSDYISAPLQFDLDRSGAARYMSSDIYGQVGFDPRLSQDDIEFRYGSMQTMSDVTSQALGGMSEIFSSTFIEGWKGWGRMTEALFSWDASKLMGSPEEREEMAKKQEDIFNKYAIYDTQESRDTIFNRQFFGNMLQQAGFTLGAAAQMILEHYVTLGIGSLFSTAGKAATFLKAGQTLGELANDTRKVAATMSRSQSVANAIAQIPRTMVPLYGTVEDIMKVKTAGASLTQMGMLGVGGIKRELSIFNMARSEAIFESASTYSDLQKRLTDEYIFSTGQAPPADIQAKINQKAEDASHDNFWVNTALLTVMNRIQFDNIIKSFNPSRKLFTDDVSRLAAKTLEVTGKIEGKTITQGFQKGMFGSLSTLPGIAKTFGKKKAAWEATKMMGKSLTKFEASEGVQELLQEASGKGLNDFYYDIYHGNKGYSSKTDAILSNIKNPLTDTDGMKTFLMGALTGRMIAPVNSVVTGVTNYKQNRDDQKQLKDDLAIVNMFLKNPVNTIYTKEWIANTKVQGKAARTMSEAASKSNQYVFQNAKNSAFAKAVATSIKLNMYESMKDTMFELGQDLSDQEFTEAFGFNPTKENKKNVQEYMTGVIEKVEDYYNTFNSLKEKYADKIIPDLYKNNSDEDYQKALVSKKVLDDAIEILTTNTVLARQTVVRAAGLQEKMSQKATIGSSTNEIVTRLGSENLIKAEIRNISNEIKKMSDPNIQLTPEQKELLTEKKKDLALVQKFESAFTDIMNEDDPSYYPSTETRAYKTFKELVEFYNQRAKIGTAIDPQDIDDSFIELVDYIRLNRDHASFVDAMNILANPRDLKIITNAMYTAHKYAEEQSIKEAAEEIKKKIDQQVAKTTDDKDKDKDKDNVPSLISYLENAYDGQIENNSTDLTFEEWLKSPSAKIFVNTYNQKYNKNEKLEGEKLDMQLQLMQLKKEIEQINISEENIEKLYDRLREILSISNEQFSKQYEEFQDSLNKEQLIEELKALGFEEGKQSEKEVTNAVSKILLLKYIDSLLANQKSATEDVTTDDDEDGEYDIISLPKVRIINSDPPKLYEGEKLVDKGKDGLYIIEKTSKTKGEKEFDPEAAKDLFGEEFGALMIKQNARNNNTFFMVVDGQRRDPITFQTKNLPTFSSADVAVDIRNKMIEKVKKNEKLEFSFFEFDGKQVRKGMVLERKLDGKQFVVMSAGAPYQETDNDGNPKLGSNNKPLPPTIKLTMLQNRRLSTSHEIVSDLSRFNIRYKEKKEKSGQYSNPDIFRLLRVNELSRIYPHQRTTPGGVLETTQQAQARLDELYIQKSANDLLNNITIKIKEIKGTRTSKLVKGKQSQKENPSLLQYSDKYQIQILYKGEPIGYLTNYDNYKFQNTATGAIISLDKLNIKEFNSIFNSQGKDTAIQKSEFEKNYRASMNVQAELVKYLNADGSEVEIPNDKVKQILGLTLSPGEYDYAKDDAMGKSTGVLFSELPYNRVDGQHYYILDISRRYGKGQVYKINETAITDARGNDRVKIEQEIAEARQLIDPLEQQGRYIAVVRLPNGRIRFVELTTDQIADDKMQGFIEQINERAKITKENNIIKEKNKDGTDMLRAKTHDYNLELNDSISGNVFISVPVQYKGTYITLRLSDTGNVQVEFFKKVNNEDIRRVITLSGTVNGKTIADPPVFLGIDDFIDKINQTIDKHDASVDIANNKIGIKLTKQNFKDSVPDVIEVSDTMKLRSSVTKNMVKNIGLNVSFVGKIQTAGDNSGSSTPSSLSDIESLVITEENYNNWSNVRDKSDYQAFVDQVRFTLSMFDQVPDKSKITAEVVYEMLDNVKAFANKAVKDKIVPLIVAKYKTSVSDKKADIERRRQELGLNRVIQVYEPSREDPHYHVTVKGDAQEFLAYVERGEWRVLAKEPSTGKYLHDIKMSYEKSREVAEKYLPKALRDLMEESDKQDTWDKQKAFEKGPIAEYVGLYRKEYLNERIPYEESLLEYYKSPTYPNKDSQQNIIKLQTEKLDTLKAELAVLESTPSSTSSKSSFSKSGNAELDKIQKDIEQLETDKKQFVAERTKFYQEPEQGLRYGEAKYKAVKEADLKYEPLIDAKQNEYNQVKNGKGSALKVVSKPEFTKESVVSIDKFRKYVQEILGDKVSVAELDVMMGKLKQNNITVGRFTTYLEQVANGTSRVKGKIEVGADTAFKYHEAFHAVFRLMLTDAQIDRYLGLAKMEVKAKGINVKSEMDKMRETHVIYSKMPEKELEERFYEEYMADNFDEWKITRDNKRNLPGLIGFFAKLWDIITEFFKKLGRSEIENLFRDIDRRKFKNSRIRENRFTKDNALSHNTPVLKAIQIGTQRVQDDNGNYIQIPKYLSQEDGEKLASTVASLYFKRVMESSEGVNKSKLLDEIIYDYTELYSMEEGAPRSNFYNDQIDKLSEQSEEMADRYIDRLTEMSNIFSSEKNIKSLKDAVDVHLNIMGFKQSMEDEAFEEMVDDFGDRVTTDNWKETHSIGGYGSLSKFLRQYIATTTYELTEGDEFGNTTFVDGTPLIQSVNANTVYNGILKAVSNISDQGKFINRLYEMKSSDTETGKFLEKFFNDTGLVVDPVTRSFELTNTKQATLFQQVIKGFQQYTVDYLFFNKDIRQNNKKTVVMLANRMGASKAQFTQWQNAYTTIFEAPLLRLDSDKKRDEYRKEKTGFLVDLINDMSPKVVVSDEDLASISKEISIAFKKNLGISLSPLYIKYSIISAKDPEYKTGQQQYFVDLYSEIEPISRDTVRQLNGSIRTGESPFSKNIDSLKEEENIFNESPERITVDTEEEDTEQDELGEGGVATRLNQIAKGNAVFDETVNTTSFKNGDGELVYAHQLPTYHLVAVQDMNNTEYLAKMMVGEDGEFLSDNMLLNTPQFESMLGTLKVERIESMKSSILEENEDGTIREDKTIISNRNKGIVYGSFSDREFLISMFELYNYNKELTDMNGKKFLTSQHLIRVIEASNTADTVSLPVMQAVNTTNDKTQLSDNAFEFLLREVKREINRIKSVRKEIMRGVFENGEIEGYHYAVDDNGRRNPNKKGRGLLFYKMRNMLGEDLASQLEEEIYNDSDTDVTTHASKISNAIKGYWNKKIDETIDKMVELAVLTRVSEKQNDGTVVTRLQNNLIADFIADGFKRSENNKSVSNEKKNAQLNLIPGNIRHNIAQIMLNDYLNTLSFNQLLYGDEAKAYKNDVDLVKRARGANGSGSSLESRVIAEDLGITHSFTQSHFLTFTDPKYKAEFAGGLKDKADAQSYTTVKGMRYALHGLGKLTPQVAKILDKIKEGEKLTVKEVINLKEIESMFNSEKLVYFDGPMYIKTSTVMLTKEFTSIYYNGEWIARPGYTELHDLRERMEKFEKDMDEKGTPTVAFAAPKSASKGRKTNIYDHIQGFQSASDDNFVVQQTKYWRQQLINPSNKLIITDPTQAKQIIIGEQDDSVLVNFMGSEADADGNPWTVGQIKQMYLKDTAQRVTNNYTRARDQIFSIEEAYKELGKAIEQNKITPKLAKFQENALETLSTTGADSQMMAFFAVDEVTGLPKYNLNNNITLDKYTQLFLAYFSKGVMSEKIPGHSLALMSNYGVKVVKRFTGKYDENGVPIGEVIPRIVVENNYDNYKNAKTWDNDIDRTFTGLNKGDFYVDDLRHNVPEYDKNGKIIGRYTEFIMPAHFEEDLRVILSEGGKIPSHLLKMFGVRIPSQAKHSFVSLRLVDFMPGYYGSTGVFPHELIEISGADFDIDKLYMHIMDTYVKKGKRVAFGTAKNIKDKFHEFVTWNRQNNKSFRKEVNKRKETDSVYNELKEKKAEIKRLNKILNSVIDTIPESERFIKDSAYNLLMASRLIDKFINDNFTDYISEISERYKGEISSVEEVTSLDDLNEMFDKLDSRSIQMLERENNITFIENLLKELPSLKLILRQIASQEQRIDSLALESLELPKNSKELSESKVEMNNGVLNNRVLESKISLLSNDHATKGGAKSIAYEVASLTALTDLLDEKVEGNFISLFKDDKGNLPKGLDEILIEGGTDVDSFLGKYKAFKNNKEGSRNIGSAVNAMLTYAVLNTFKVPLRKTYNRIVIVDGKTTIEKIPMYLFKLDGNTYTDYGNNNSFNVQTGEYDGLDRITNMISTMVSAMTDNAKERLAARLGLNIESLGYAANLISQGVPLRSAVMLMLQPVVREYFKEISVIKNNIKTNSESQMSKSAVAKGILEKYTKEAGEDYQKLSLTTEMLVQNIKDNGASAIYQASVFTDFIGIMNQSRYFSLTAQILKLTKGLGTSYEEYNKVDEAIDVLGLDIQDDYQFEKHTAASEKTPPAIDLRQMLMGYKPDQPHHEFMKQYILIAKQISQLSKSAFIERTESFKRIIEVVKENFNVKWNLKEKFNTDLKRDLISYLSIKAYRKFLIDTNRVKTLESMHNGLIYDEAAIQAGPGFNDIYDITKTIREKMPENYFMNYFVNLISTTSYDTNGNVQLNKKNRDGVNKLESNSWAKLSEFQIEKLRDSFIEIFGSDIDFDGKNGREIANVLLNYLIVKDGAQFKSNSFLRYVPDFMFTNLLLSTGKANDVLKKDITERNKEELDKEYEDVFGINSSELFNEFVSIYSIHAGNTPYIKSMIKGKPQYKQTGVPSVDEYDPQSFVEVQKVNDMPYSQLVYQSLDRATAPAGGMVVIDQERGKLASTDGSIIAYPTRGTAGKMTEKDLITGLKLDNSIGNPWNTRGFSIYTSSSIKDSVENFIAWMLGEKHTDKLQDYRKEILSKIGTLKKKPILYYVNIAQPSHASALDYLINKHDWAKEIKPVENPATVLTGLSINIFRGARTKDAEAIDVKENEEGVNVSELTDEEYVEYVNNQNSQEALQAEPAPKEVVKKEKGGGYSSEEKKKFAKNMELLRFRGFKTNDKGEVEFPYIIKMSTKAKDNRYGKDQLFVLKSVKKIGKKGKTVKIKNKSLFIQSDELVASGVSAFYAPIEREGSPSTFKAGKMFGHLPGKATKARIRRKNAAPVVNNEQYNDQPASMTNPNTVIIETKSGTGTTAAKLFSQHTNALQQTIPEGVNPADILRKHYGIEMSFELGKGIAYSGTVYDMIPDNLKSGIKTPVDLLQVLNYFGPQQSFVITPSTGFYEEQKPTSSPIEDFKENNEEFKSESENMTNIQKKKLLDDIMNFDSTDDNNPLNDECANP